MQTPGSGWADLAAIAFIVLFFGLFFARVFINHRFILTGDAFYYTYPLRTVAWNMIRGGQMPVWTPLLLSGYPLGSVALLGLGYPLTWGYLLLPGHWAEQIYALAPFLLSPITTFAYARQIGRSLLASLLAGLCFGYGGMMCGILANSGMLTNSLIWAPLVLLFIDRARTRSFIPCLVWASLSYSLSVLAGHAQSYTYVGGLAIAYGFYSSRPWAGSDQARFVKWRPALVAFGAIVSAAAIAAFQLLQTVTAAGLSVRKDLSYQTFSEGSFSIREATLSLGAQLYHYVDSGTFITPLGLVLALVAVVYTTTRRTEDSRIWFWLISAAVAFVLLLGENTPVNRIVFHIPLYNKFRVPSRHTFEWTLAIAILAAYGWDAAELLLSHKPVKRSLLSALATAGLFVATCVVGVLWWRKIVQWPKPNLTVFTGLEEKSFWLWKLAFTVLLFAFLWVSFKLKQKRFRPAALIAGIALACFVEANATASCSWAGFVSLPESRFHVVSNATAFLQKLPAAQNRVYTRVGMFSEEFRNVPRLDGPNLSMIYGLQNVAGMEPLILSRYSQALGDVGPDSVTPRPGFPARNDLLTERSHVLDLLNTTHVVTYSGSLRIVEDAFEQRNGIPFAVGDLNLNLSPGASLNLWGDGSIADTLAFVTSLSNSVSQTQGGPVAKIRLITAGADPVEVTLRAGVETAEWAHERADVRKLIKHELAQVFDSRPGDEQHTYLANRYWARLPLGKLAHIQQVEITNVSHDATLTIWKATAINSETGDHSALANDNRSSFWSTVYLQDHVEILRNARALPRAWLVAEAESANAVEALHSIRGESVRPFDPRRTALLEVDPAELPVLPGGEISGNSSAQLVSFEPGHLAIQTYAPTSTILVVSEIFYPGWEATIDGQPARILLTDYLIRGVALTSGAHRVEMRYTPQAARKGLLISVFTLMVLAGLLVYTRMRHVS